jgi:hypothetical protein
MQPMAVVVFAQTGIGKDSSQADHDDNKQDQETIEEEVPIQPPAG